jgi:Zn-dependent metalloprotease
MKKVLVLIILIHLFACEKSQLCSDIVKGKPENHLISDSELNIVTSLFKSNNLSLDNFCVFRLQKDDLGYSHVRCYQYINNLKILSDYVIFHFDKTGHYYFLSGEIIPNIDIKPSPSMDVREVISLFLQSVKNDDFYSTSIKQIENGCISCEIGYYDLNAGISYASQNFKLAWRIRPEESEYPFALINDSNNTLIYYDNGIRY